MIAAKKVMMQTITTTVLSRGDKMGETVKSHSFHFRICYFLHFSSLSFFSSEWNTGTLQMLSKKRFNKWQQVTDSGQWWLQGLQAERTSNGPVVLLLLRWMQSSGEPELPQDSPAISFWRRRRALSLQRKKQMTITVVFIKVALYAILVRITAEIEQLHWW